MLHHVTALRQSWEQIAPVIALHSAPDFTPFEFVESSELGLSRLVRWLFDTNASHGQGGLFLKAFCEQFAKFSVPPSCTVSKAQCEVTTTARGHEGRRIDIVVEFDRHCLAIENKPWAGFQHNQLRAYDADIAQRFPPQRRRIVALLGRPGAIPDDQRNGLSRETLTETDYHALADCIRSTIPDCHAEPVRRFLEQFCDYLDRLFRGASITILSDQLAGHIASKPDLVAPALDVLAARDGIITAIGLNFIEQLQGACAENDIQVETDTGQLTIRFGWIKLSRSKDCKSELYVQFRGADFDGFTFGVLKNESDSVKREADRALERGAITKLYPGNQWWSWYEYNREDYLGVDCSDQISIWKAMHAGTLARVFADRADAYLKACTIIANE